MNSRKKWVLGAGVVAVVLGAIAVVVVAWLPSDEEFAARLKVEAEKRLGVGVTIGSAHWSLFPQPVAVIRDLRTDQEEPVVIGRLVAQAGLRSLIRRDFVLSKLTIEDATLPRNSLMAFRGKPGAGAPDASARAPLQRFHFRNVTWIPYSGVAVAYDGEIDFDNNWRPRHGELRRPGAPPPFTLTIEREADADRWGVAIDVGGGTANGNVELSSAADGLLQLRGQLAPRDIDVASALDTFNRRSPIGGKASGTTVLSAKGESVPDLARSLHTRSVLSIASAKMLRFDLDRAVSTLGKEHDGQTALQELTGQIDTQNTHEGMRITYTNVKARHDRYTARAEAVIYHRQVDATGTLDIVDGLVGVPFGLHGPTNKPKVSIPPGFFAGAVIGTAIVPVIGTAIGARIGGAIGGIFKGKAAEPPQSGGPAVGASKKN